MAKYGRKTMRLDTSGFESLIRKLDSLGGDVKTAAEVTLKKAGQRIQTDTHIALNNSYLPAYGKYWTGRTSKTIIDNPTVEWSGTVASIPVGFDFKKPGAGGYLISGTPKMKPDPQLRKMYKSKQYMNEIQDLMIESMNEFILKEMEDK